MTLLPNSVLAECQEGLAAALDLLEGIEALPAHALTFDATVGALDGIYAHLVTLSGRTEFLAECHPDEAVRDAARAAGELRAKFETDLYFRPVLAARIRDYSVTAEARSLTGARARLLEDTLESFADAGHDLPESAQRDLRELRERLVELELEFAENLADDDYVDVVAAQLTGLPADFIASLQDGDAPGTKRVTTCYPHVSAVLESCSNRTIRERVADLFASRAAAPNRALLAEALDIRHRIAGLFGFDSWARYALRDRMAETPEAVAAFYESLQPALTLAAGAELRRMQALLDDDLASGATGGPADLQGYDRAYYEARIRSRDHGLDPWQIAEHFPIERVLDGLLHLCSDVFGLRFAALDAPVWHPDVRVLQISDATDGRTIGHVYLDLHPRPGKFSHAAAFPLVCGWQRPDGTYQAPVSAVLANFTPPSAGRPALLTHDEVVTLFHEFGHVLHQTLTTSPLATYSGTNTEWDFVEAPSQIMEHWAWEPEVLRGFARHYRTGEPLPASLLQSMVAARDLNQALITLRQMSLGLLDQGYHGADQPVDLQAVLERTSAVSLFPNRPGTFSPASFGHLMGGYDAGYYGYLWSEVYGDDMFSEFRRCGVTSPEVGARYRRCILERGGTVDALDQMRDFLGREPQQEAFLIGKGLAAAA